MYRPDYMSKPIFYLIVAIAYLYFVVDRVE